MSDFDDLLRDADTGIFEILGDACTYEDNQGGTFETRVVIDRDVEAVSMYDTQMSALRNVASVPKGDVPEPKRGHKITQGANVYIVDALDSDDGHVLRLLLQ